MCVGYIYVYVCISGLKCFHMDNDECKDPNNTCEEICITHHRIINIAAVFVESRVVEKKTACISKSIELINMEHSTYVWKWYS